MYDGLIGDEISNNLEDVCAVIIIFSTFETVKKSPFLKSNSFKETSPSSVKKEWILSFSILILTGSFKFPSTTHITHKVVSNLLKTGISHAEIHNQIYDNNKFERVQLLSFALSNITIIENLNTCFISLTQKDLDRLKYEKGDTEGIVNYGLSIKNIKFAVIFMENSKENVVRISLRSRGNFDVNEFSKNIFGGGGHKNAAGAISKKTLNQTIDYFKESLDNYKNLLK